jgi:hypothetical protein
MTSRSIVIGNGESRKKINFKEVEGVKIGCNAIHREYFVDHLVCVDRRTLREACESSNTEKTKIYTRPEWKSMGWKNRQVIDIPLLPYSGNQRPDNVIHWGSGPFAILVASSIEHSDIHILGFDLYGIKGKVNNVYKGTDNYSDVNSNEVDPRYWIYQIGKVFQLFPDKYYHVYNSIYWKIPDEWRQQNVQFKELDRFSWKL